MQRAMICTGECGGASPLGGATFRVPSGDAQRVWFPEMLEVLSAAWTPGTTWDELVDLCRRLTALRTSLRKLRGIQPPLTRCPKCGSVSRGDVEGVSIRSALFALRKVGTLSEADFVRLDREWKKLRAARGLDALGRRDDASSATTASDPTGCC